MPFFLCNIRKKQNKASLSMHSCLFIVKAGGKVHHE